MVGSIGESGLICRDRSEHFMCKFERKLTFYGLPALVRDLLIRLRPVHVSCGAAKEELGYDLLK